MPAAARRIEPEHVAGAQRIVGVTGRQAFRCVGLGVDRDVAGASAHAADAAVWRNDVSHGPNGEAGIRKVEILAANAEPAAPLAGTAGIRDQLETGYAGRKLAFDDLDRRDLGIALVDGDSGAAVLGRARAGAAGDDLVLDVAPSTVCAAAAENDRTAAATVGAYLAWHDVAHGVEYGVDQRMDGGVVGIDRGGKARIEHAAIARGHGEAAHKPARDVHVRVDQGDQRVGTGRLHKGRADIGRPSGLVGGTAEIEMEPIVLLVDDDVDAHGHLQVDAVVVDEPLRLEAAVLPFGDG
jgi:hypothetical protein